VTLAQLGEPGISSTAPITPGTHPGRRAGSQAVGRQHDRTACRRPRDGEARQAGRTPRPPGTPTGRQARREGWR